MSTWTMPAPIEWESDGPLPDHAEWKARGACIDVDPDIFFPEARSRFSGSYYERARLICSRCPVRKSCLDHALAEPERYGMWGGKTPLERRQLRKERGMFDAAHLWALQ